LDCRNDTIVEFLSPSQEGEKICPTVAKVSDVVASRLAIGTEKNLGQFLMRKIRLA
jgi:hypothetical protein